MKQYCIEKRSVKMLSNSGETRTRVIQAIIMKDQAESVIYGPVIRIVRDRMDNISRT